MSIRLFNPSGGFIDLNAGGDGTAANTFTLPAETGTLLTSASNIETQVKTATNASGSAPIYACRAWVNFNGTGTPAIRASGNVSSITDNGTGDYTVNFTTAMSDTNYSTQVTATTRNEASGLNWVCGLYSVVTGTASGVNTSSVRVVTGKRPDESGWNDEDTINVAIFR